MIAEFFSGALLSLSLELPLGPINTMIIARSMKYDWAEGLKVGWGAWLAQVVLLVALYFGVFPLVSGHLPALFVAGGIALLLFGIDTMKSLSSAHLVGKNEKVGDSFVAGFFLGISNPIQIIWQLTVGLSLLASSVWLVVGLFAGSGLFITVLPFLAGKAKNFFGSSFYRIVLVVAALLLFAFGLLFLHQGLTGATDFQSLDRLWNLQSNVHAMTLFLSGVLLGVSLFISPGPIFTTVVARSVKYNWVEGVKVSLGTLAADFLLMLAVFFGFFPLINQNLTALFIASGILLFILGIDLVRSKSTVPLEGKVGMLGDSFIAGFFLGISNPILIIFWLTVGLSLLATSWWIVVGLLSTLVVCETLLALTADRVKHWFRGRLYGALAVLAALFLFGFSFIFLYQGLTGVSDLGQLSKIWSFEASGEAVAFFLSGLLLSISLVLSPGPILTTMVSRAVKYEWWQGTFVSLGASTAHVVLMVVLLLGVFPLLQGHFSELFVVSSLVLFWFGIDTLKGVRSAGLQEKKEIQGNSFLGGFFIGVSNPLQIMWWLTVGLSLFATSWMIIIGVFVGVIILSLLVPFLANRMKRFIGTTAYKVLLVFLALYLFALGISFLYSGLTDSHNMLIG